MVSKLLDIYNLTRIDIDVKCIDPGFFLAFSFNKAIFAAKQSAGVKDKSEI
jgi:hypothetical protein